MTRDAGLAERVQNALAAYGWYLEKTLWPTNLAVIYPYPAAVSAAGWAGCALLLIAISAVALWRRRSDPALLCGWLAFLGMLVPTIGLIQAGPQPYADRFTYMASLPLTVALAAGVAALANRAPAAWRPRAVRLLASLAIGAILMLAVRTHEQVLTWRSGEAAFAHAYTAVEGNTIAAMNLTALRIGKGSYASALRPAEMAALAEPESAVHQYNLGAALAGLKRWEESERALRRSTGLDPERAEGWSLLGRVQREEGKKVEAIGSYRESVRAGLSPVEESRVRTQLGLLLLGVGQELRSSASSRGGEEPGNESASNLVVFLSGRTDWKRRCRSPGSRSSGSRKTGRHAGWLLRSKRGPRGAAQKNLRPWKQAPNSRACIFPAYHGNWHFPLDVRWSESLR